MLKKVKEAMKKILKYRRKKISQEEIQQRITNETVAEHRERILSVGRKFKYPVQYAKHRLVINTIVVSLIALFAGLFVVWQQLYIAQNTSTFFYRITRAIPVPVASVDGQLVRYSDYLERFKSQEHYLLTKQALNLYSKENQSQLDSLKRKVLDDSVTYGYAEKLASEYGIKVTSEEVDASIKRQRQSSDGEISEKAYFDVTLDHFGWSPDEVREITARDLLKQKVAFRVDDVADKLRDKMVAATKSEADFNKAAVKISAIDGVKVEVSETPLVPVNNRDDGLAEHASKLKVGDVSDVFKSTIRGDGYYIVKLLSREGDRISYVSMKAPLTVFQKKLSELRQNGGVKEYISVPTIEAISKSKN